MPGLFDNPEFIAQQEQAQRRAEFNNTSPQQLISGAFVNLGDKLGRGFINATGGDTRSAEVRRAQAIKEQTTKLRFDDPQTFFEVSNALNQAGEFEAAARVMSALPKSEKEKQNGEPFFLNIPVTHEDGRQGIRRAIMQYRDGKLTEVTGINIGPGSNGPTFSGFSSTVEGIRLDDDQRKNLTEKFRKSPGFKENSIGLGGAEEESFPVVMEEVARIATAMKQQDFHRKNLEGINSGQQPIMSDLPSDNEYVARAFDLLAGAGFPNLRDDNLVTPGGSATVDPLTRNTLGSLSSEVQRQEARRQAQRDSTDRAPEFTRGVFGKEFRLDSLDRGTAQPIFSNMSTKTDEQVRAQLPGTMTNKVFEGHANFWQLMRENDRYVNEWLVRDPGQAKASWIQRTLDSAAEGQNWQKFFDIKRINFYLSRVEDSKRQERRQGGGPSAAGQRN